MGQTEYSARERDEKIMTDHAHYVFCLDQGLELTDKQLGAGAYSDVRLAHVVSIENQALFGFTKVAVKIVSKFRTSNGTTKEFLTQEMENHELLSGHENIVRLLRVFDTTKYAYMVMEQCSGGNLLDYINSNGHPGLLESMSRSIFHQLCQATAFCHSKHIVHRDIKCENILIDLFGRIKLADFGFSCVVRDNSRDLHNFCGSPAYAAPEIIRGKPYNGKLADIWSLGVVLYCMSCGRLPYTERNKLLLLEDMQFQRLHFGCKNLSCELILLLRRILQYDDLRRIPIRKMIDDAWTKGKKLTSIPRTYKDTISYHSHTIKSQEDHTSQRPPTSINVGATTNSETILLKSRHPKRNKCLPEAVCSSQVPGERYKEADLQDFKGWYKAKGLRMYVTRPTSNDETEYIPHQAWQLDSNSFQIIVKPVPIKSKPHSRPGSTKEKVKVKPLPANGIYSQENLTNKNMKEQPFPENAIHSHSQENLTKKNIKEQPFPESGIYSQENLTKEKEKFLPANAENLRMENINKKDKGCCNPIKHIVRLPDLGGQETNTATNRHAELADVYTHSNTSYTQDFQAGESHSSQKTTECDSEDKIPHDVQNYENIPTLPKVSCKIPKEAKEETNTTQCEDLREAQSNTSLHACSTYYMETRGVTKNTHSPATTYDPCCVLSCWDRLHSILRDLVSTIHADREAAAKELAAAWNLQPSFGRMSQEQAVLAVTTWWRSLSAGGSNKNTPCRSHGIKCKGHIASKSCARAKSTAAVGKCSPVRMDRKPANSPVSQTSDNTDSAKKQKLLSVKKVSEKNNIGGSAETVKQIPKIYQKWAMRLTEGIAQEEVRMKAIYKEQLAPVVKPFRGMSYPRRLSVTTTKSLNCSGDSVIIKLGNNLSKASAGFRSHPPLRPY